MSTTTPPNDSQSEAIGFLAGGAGFAAKAKRIDTHGAMIFLIGDHALKIKRAVKYDYMDLSTPEKRHALLDREFALNKSTAPSIYHGVVPLVRTQDGTLELDGKGETVEWVLKMHRFPLEAELSHIAEARGIDDDLAGQLGASIAKYHAAAPVSPLDGETLIREILDELDRVFSTMSDVLGPDTATFISQSRKLCADLANDMSHRTRQGHVRRCHGDLHLRNIVMIGATPTPFDALEFDERLGTCDTLYDLAFLLMDLDHLGMTHAANVVLNAYLTSATADMSQTGLALLPLYLGIRAAIRAMVDVQTSAVSSDSDALVTDAKAYLSKALAYLSPTAPTLVAIGGFSGTGKTTIARAIAHRIGPKPGAILLRSDVTRKSMLHQDPLDRLGDDGYTAEITQDTYAAIRSQAADVLKQGHSAILDAVHGDPISRSAAQAVAQASGCAFAGIWLETRTQTRLTRVAKRAPDASDADETVVRQQAETNPGPISWQRISTDQPVDAVIDAISAVLCPRIECKKDRGGRNVG